MIGKPAMAAGLLCGSMFAHVAADAGATDGAPLFLGGTAPDASGDGVPERPGEARRPRRACPADPFSLRRDRGWPSPGWRARGGRPPGTAASGGLPSPEPRRPRRGFPAGRAGPTMPSSPVGRYPHPDCTSDKAPADDVWSGSGSGGAACSSRKLGPAVSLRRSAVKVRIPRCPFPAAQSKQGNCLLTPLHATERTRGIPAKGRSQVNIARADAKGGRAWKVKKKLCPISLLADSGSARSGQWAA
jgi:hypothetical protein